MISQELFPKNHRENLEAEKWLVNTDFEEAKYFNETGHQFFKQGKYKKHRKATQLDVTKRIVFVLERIEAEYLKQADIIAQLKEKITLLESEK